MRKRTLKPEGVFPAITGKAGLEDGEYECEGMAVARYKGGQLESIACDGSGHGAHGKFAPKFEQLYQKYGTMLKRPEAKDCGKCKGTGWVTPESPEGKTMVMVCTVMSLFRGIQIRIDPDLIIQGGSANLGSFFK